MTASACVAIDVGGTKVDVARVTTDGYIHERVRIDTKAAGDELFERIVEAVSSLEVGRTELIGVGCGGPPRPWLSQKVVSELRVGSRISSAWWFLLASAGALF